MKGARVEVGMQAITREDGEAEPWPAFEVKVRHAHVDGAFCVDVKARDEEHARVLLEEASDRITVIAVKPLEECEGCPTCLTFGGCSQQPMSARELPRNLNVARWLGGLCQGLGRVLQPTGA